MIGVATGCADPAFAAGEARAVSVATTDDDEPGLALDWLAREEEADLGDGGPAMLLRLHSCALGAAALGVAWRGVAWRGVAWRCAASPADKSRCG